MKRDLNKKQELILQLINQLTQDEDFRQDLWVTYLSGTPLERLPHSLLCINIHDSIENNKYAIQRLICNPPTQEFIDYLTETERLVVCLLMLGYSLGTIGIYSGMSEVRINQILVALRNSKAWNKYGIKENVD